MPSSLNGRHRCLSVKSLRLTSTTSLNYLNRNGAATGTHTLLWESRLVPLKETAEVGEFQENDTYKSSLLISMRKCVYICRKCSSVLTDDCRALCGVGPTHIDAWEIEVLSVTDAGSDDSDAFSDSHADDEEIIPSPDLEVADFFHTPSRNENKMPQDYLINVANFETPPPSGIVRGSPFLTRTSPQPSGSTGFRVKNATLLAPPQGGNEGWVDRIEDKNNQSPFNKKGKWLIEPTVPHSASISSSRNISPKTLSLSDHLYGLNCFRRSALVGVRRSPAMRPPAELFVSSDDSIGGTESPSRTNDDFHDDQSEDYCGMPSNNTSTTMSRVIKKNKTFLYHSGVAKWPFRDR